MPLTFSPEQLAFREAVRSFLADKSPEDEVRRLMATDEGYDAAVWAQLNEQLGAAGLAVPEEYGGSGYTFRELAIVLEEAGRSLLCAPLLSSVIASSAITASGDALAAKELLPGIAQGTTIATVAFTHAGQDWDSSGGDRDGPAGGRGRVLDRIGDRRLRHRRPHRRPDPGARQHARGAQPVRGPRR